MRTQNIGFFIPEFAEWYGPSCPFHQIRTGNTLHE